MKDDRIEQLRQETDEEYTTEPPIVLGEPPPQDFKEFIAVEDTRRGYRIQLGSNINSAKTLCNKALWILNNIINKENKKENGRSYIT